MEIIREKQKTPRPLRRTPAKSEKELIDKIFNQPRKEWLTPQTGFMGGPTPKRTSYEMVLWSWLAAVIDTLLVTAVSCFFVIAFSFLMKTSLGSIASEVIGKKSTFFLFLQFFIAHNWIYMVFSRGLFGYSIGEMTCNIRLGQPHQRMQLSYLPRVIVRETLIIATGIILLPLVSLIIGKDLTGKMTGLSLYSLK